MVVKSQNHSKKPMNKGAWTAEEDRRLSEYIKLHGDKKWRTIPAGAGLNRCGKSCRLRWLNYLRPDIKRGNISEEEEDLMMRLHNLLGNRWSLIAGRLPGRTDNEIKNYWNTHLCKKSLSMNELNGKIKNKDNRGQKSSPPCTTSCPAFSSDPGETNYEKAGVSKRQWLRQADLLAIQDLDLDKDIDRFFDFRGSDSDGMSDQQNVGDHHNNLTDESQVWEMNGGMCNELLDYAELQMPSMYGESDFYQSDFQTWSRLLGNSQMDMGNTGSF